MMAFYGIGIGHPSSIRLLPIGGSISAPGSAKERTRISSAGGNTGTSSLSRIERTERASVLLFWAVACVALAILFDQLGYVHLVPALVCLSELLVWAAIVWAAAKLILSFRRR